MKRKKINSNLVGNRSGNAVLDTIMVLIVIFIFVVLAIVGRVVFNDLNTDIQASDDFNNSTKQNIDELNTRMPIFMDNAFVMVVVLLTLLVIGFSMFIDSNPIFFIVALLLLVIVFYVGGVLSNTYSELADEDYLSSAADEFAKTKWIMEHLLEIVVVIGFLILLALYGKSQYG